MNFHRLKIFAVLLAVAALGTAVLPSALAEDVSVAATVTANRLSLGNSAQLIVTVRGTQKVEPASLPPIDGFDTRYIGPQTQVSIVNGNYTSSKSFIYSLFPNKTGQFKIPSFSLTVDGQEFHTDPIDMTVEDAPAAGSATASGSGGDVSAASLKDKIMLIMGTSKNEVYVGEQVPLTVKLLYTGVTISEIQFPTFDFVGFTKDDFGQPQQSQQVINGVGYNVVDFKTFVSPIRTGELTLGPAKLEANLVYRNAMQNNFGSNGFANDIFDNFFNNYEKRVLTATSQSLHLNVLPLPEEGKPQNFSGAVGQFDFTATVGPSEVKVGDPLTLRMKITGNGNLKSIALPAFNDTKFKIYDPQVKDEGNTKTLEQVIIPTSENITEVPALYFSYFDTQEKKYKTIRQGPFSVSVKAPQPGEEFKAVGFESATPKVTIKEELGQDIVFIKERPGALRPLNYHIYKNVWFWIFVVAYLVAWGVALTMYFIRRRLKTDERFARRFKAPRQAREGIAQAEVYLVQGQVKEFYGAVTKTLKDYLGNQLHMPSGGMTFVTIEPILRSKKIDPRIIQSIKTIFEAADMVRFASVNLDEGNMAKTFESLKVIIDDLERHL
jgi:hypothetical protein